MALMEIVAAGNSRGHAKAFTDMKIKIKDRQYKLGASLTGILSYGRNWYHAWIT
jgi:hypothetical protein